MEFPLLQKWIIQYTCLDQSTPKRISYRMLIDYIEIMKLPICLLYLIVLIYKKVLIATSKSMDMDMDMDTDTDMDVDMDMDTDMLPGGRVPAPVKCAGSVCVAPRGMGRNFQGVVHILRR